MLRLLLVLPLACALLPAGRGIPRDLAMMARKKNNTSTEAKHRRASDMMASFDEYLRDGRLLEDYNKATLLEKQEVYNNWLRLQNLPTIAPGNVHPRLLNASMLNFESHTLHCLVPA